MENITPIASFLCDVTVDLVFQSQSVHTKFSIYMPLLIAVRVDNALKCSLEWEISTVRKYES